MFSVQIAKVRFECTFFHCVILLSNLLLSCCYREFIHSVHIISFFLVNRARGTAYVTLAVDI